MINFSFPGSRNPEPVCHQLCFRSRSGLEPDPGESFRRQWLIKKGQGLEFRCLERGLDEEGWSSGFVLQRMASSRCFERARWRRLRKIITIYCDSIQSNELQNIFESLVTLLITVFKSLIYNFWNNLVIAERNLDI